MIAAERRYIAAASVADLTDNTTELASDRLVSRVPLYDLDGHRVGRVKGECVVVSNRITATAGLWRCSYLLELAGGDLVVEGLDPRGPGAYTMAVLGGTEGYRTVAGDADFVDTATRTEMYLHLEV